MIMKISKISTLVAAAVAASVISVAAFASDSANQLPQQKVDFGINAAYAWLNAPSSESLNTGKKHVGHIGYGASVGYGYQVIPNLYLGADLGYQDNGRTKYNDSTASGANNNVKVKSKMVTLLASADYFVTPNWDVVGKVGPAYVWQTVSYTNSTPSSVSNKTHKVAPYVSLGTGYHFDNSMSVSIAYDHLFGASKSSSITVAKPKIRSVNAIQLTVGYTLPF
jgi:opacity protein-like surface antigen